MDISAGNGNLFAAPETENTRLENGFAAQKNAVSPVGLAGCPAKPHSSAGYSISPPEGVRFNVVKVFVSP